MAPKARRIASYEGRWQGARTRPRPIGLRNLARFFRGASAKQKGLDGHSPKPFILLVEPTGIEPVTSTMPLYPKNNKIND